MPALIVFEFEQKLRLFEAEIFGPKPLSFRCTSIKKVTIFREFPLYKRSLVVLSITNIKKEMSNVLREVEGHKSLR